MAVNNWYVITGPPSSGKSTLITELSKLGYQTLNESGRLLIDQELASGKTLEEIRVDSPEFEVSWIKFQQAREKTLDSNELTFFDRGLLDCLAYFKFYNWQVPDVMKEICNQAQYKKVFLCELLEYEKDYARVESAETALAMQELFGEVYREAGYEVITLPNVSIEMRVKSILQQVGE